MSIKEQNNLKESQSRLIGKLPKVGIRPIIDGRRKGVRESLEEQTLGMANAAAKLIFENIKHSNGAEVECVIPNFCIGGVAEAAMVEELFKQNNVGVSLSVTPCWAYGLEVMDTQIDIPKAVWGFNGTERPGAVHLAAALAGYNQLGYPVWGIYGDMVQDKDDYSIHLDVADKILNFVKAGLVVSEIRGKSYLSIGSVSMGIAGSYPDISFFNDYLGMRIEFADMVEIQRRISENIFDVDEFHSANKWRKENCKEGEDTNPINLQASNEQKENEWEISLKMAMIVRDLMVGNAKLSQIGFGEESLGRNAIIAGFQGQRNWTDFMPNGDFMEAILNSSFDWNGIREPFLVATENDTLNAVTMLFGQKLTNTAQIFADVRTYWSPDSVFKTTGYKLEGIAKNGIIHMINSGPAALDGTGEQNHDGKPAIKPWWEITEKEAKACLKATKWYPAEREYFRGGGFSSNYLSKGNMPLTASRINLVKNLGPVLQIAEGYSVELPAEVHEKLNNRTSPTWPTTWFAPILTGEGVFKDVYSVMENWGANHCSISYGHIGHLLITLAAMLRIPVNMHNVNRSKIFRPSLWKAFGTADLEGADFRACKTLGPLYKK